MGGIDSKKLFEKNLYREQNKGLHGRLTLLSFNLLLPFRFSPYGRG